jgi:hypothetical protein
MISVNVSQPAGEQLFASFPSTLLYKGNNLVGYGSNTSNLAAFAKRAAGPPAQYKQVARQARGQKAPEHNSMAWEGSNTVAGNSMFPQKVQSR